uniref:Uncharacterized protein n=1 Tax=Triticum urartu TaxID=4572 RepID=A0A8R7TQ27_TRIUA
MNSDAPAWYVFVSRLTLGVSLPDTERMPIRRAPRRDAAVDHKEKHRPAAKGHQAGWLIVAHAQGGEAAGCDAGVLDCSVLQVDVVAQGPSMVGVAASDGAVAWGVEAGLFMCQFLREPDRLGAPVLLERARHGKAAEDAPPGVAAGALQGTQAATTVLQIRAAL